MKPGHALTHRSGQRHNNSKGGHGRGVQRDGPAEGGGLGEGMGEGGGAGCACACRPHVDRTAAEHTPRPRSAAASDLHERVARQGQGQAVGR